MSNNKGKNSVLMAFILCSVVGKNLVSGYFPKAQDVAWTSVNFKTLLTWNPPPTNYSYTVEFSALRQNRERSPYCIKTMATECDLTSLLKDLKATYTADVVSDQLEDTAPDLVEQPHTTSPRFCPYKDTIIDTPEFKIEVSKDKRKTTLYVTDILTAIFDDQNRQLNIRDIFKEDLHYKVIFNRAGSTGKKENISRSSQIELTGLDRGQSYCFSVQAYIASRDVAKRLGKLSQTQCSEGGGKTLFEEYGIGVIAGAILFIVVVVAVSIAVMVVCCKRRRQAQTKGKEGVPLRSV